MEKTLLTQISTTIRRYPPSQNLKILLDRRKKIVEPLLGLRNGGKRVVQAGQQHVNEGETSKRAIGDW